jgi:hypothetical protein
MVMEALGITAPVGSVTVPLREDVWPNSPEDKNRNSEAQTKRFFIGAISTRNSGMNVIYHETESDSINLSS